MKSHRSSWKKLTTFLWRQILRMSTPKEGTRSISTRGKLLRIIARNDVIKISMTIIMVWIFFIGRSLETKNRARINCSDIEKIVKSSSKKRSMAAARIANGSIFMMTPHLCDIRSRKRASNIIDKTACKLNLKRSLIKTRMLALEKTKAS